MKADPIIIPLPPLFSFKECLWFLNRNFDDCMHSVQGNRVVKALEINNKHLLISITGNDQQLTATVIHGKANNVDRVAIQEYVTEWFDLKNDLQPFYTLLAKHDALAYMHGSFHGLRLISIPDMFEALCWSIIGQQINLAFAYKLKRRMVERFGQSIEFENHVYYIFPKPQALAEATVAELRTMQFSEKKAEYIIGVAKLFATGKLSKAIVAALPDIAAQQKALTDIRGIGIWTANYTLMKSLRIPTLIPHGDAGLLNALIGHGIIEQKTELQKIERLFKKYKGWESYLVTYLWRSLAVKDDEL